MPLNIWEEYDKENRLDAKQRTPGEYVEVMVINGYFSNDPKAVFYKKWYWMLEGEIIFCKVQRYFDARIRYKVKDLMPCRLINSKIHQGRQIDPKDCILI